MKTDISILLDRSGSMQAIAKDTIGGFNAWLASQKAESGQASVSLVQFDSEGFDYTFSGTDVKMVADLTNETFRPRGSTPLLDAMARLIRETGQRLARTSPFERPDKVIVIIITDGEENCSRETTRKQVFDMVSHQREKYSWEFIYLGANQDAISVGASLGVAAGLSATYAGQYTTSAYNVLSRSTSSLRVGASLADASFTTAEQSAMVNGDSSQPPL